jgi:hypothetical protein
MRAISRYFGIRSSVLKKKAAASAILVGTTSFSVPSGTNDISVPLPMNVAGDIAVMLIASESWSPSVSGWTAHLGANGLMNAVALTKTLTGGETSADISFSAGFRRALVGVAVYRGASAITLKDTETGSGAGLNASAITAAANTRGLILAAVMDATGAPTPDTLSGITNVVTEGPASGSDFVCGVLADRLPSVNPYTSVTPGVHWPAGSSNALFTFELTGS